MRRSLATALVVSAALAGAGCGGGDSDSALDVALSYLPRDAAVAVAVDTDLEGDQYRALDTLLGRFAFSGEIRDQLRERLGEATGGRFDEDVRPLLGNPLVIGLASGGAEPIGAVQVEDEEKLAELVQRNARRVGESAGATLYEGGDTFYAVEGDVLAFGSSRRDLTAALERADGEDHLDEEAFDSALEDLPEEALARIYADVEALLRADAGSADARRVEWIASLRTLGQTVVATRDGLETSFRLTTEGDLSEADLPVAPGEEAPGVISRDGEVGLGIRDLAHIVRFAENAAQAVDPAGYGDYAQAKRTIDTQLGVSLDDDLIGQLNGNVSASLALDGGFGVRAELDDPDAFEDTLAKVADVLPSFAQGAGFGEVALTKPGAAGGFYVLRERSGGQVVFGVVDGVLVVASDRARADQLAAEEPTAVEGAAGSVVVNADAGQLANALLEEFGGAFGIPDLGGLGAGIITAPLGPLSGHVSASPDELRGRMTLVIE